MSTSTSTTSARSPTATWSASDPLGDGPGTGTPKGAHRNGGRPSSCQARPGPQDPAAGISGSLTAGELLAERLQRLVGGEGAARLLLRSSGGRVRRGLAGLRSGHLGLGLLLDVS